MANCWPSHGGLWLGSSRWCHMHQSSEPSHHGHPKSEKGCQGQERVWQSALPLPCPLTCLLTRISFWQGPFDKELTFWQGPFDKEITFWQGPFGKEITFLARTFWQGIASRNYRLWAKLWAKKVTMCMGDMHACNNTNQYKNQLNQGLFHHAKSIETNQYFFQ